MPAHVCPLCRSERTAVFHHLPRVPLVLNRLFRTRAQARRAATGELLSVACEGCTLVWNAAFEEGRSVYDGCYVPDQTWSAVFKRHVDSRLDRIVAATADIDNAHVLEIGCGQGDFLAQLVKRSSGRIGAASGLDPAWRGEDGTGPGASIFADYFTPTSVRRLPRPVDVAVSRHMLSYVPDPVGFLRTLRAAGTPRLRLFVETPCARWIVQRRHFHDLHHEYRWLFTEASLALALRRAGFVTKRSERIFGGQYLWVEAEADGAEAASCAGPMVTEALPIERWRSDFAGYVEKWRGLIEHHARTRAVYVWSAAGKGTSFAAMLDPDGARLAGAVDINPDKHGLHLPGSGLRVIAPEELPRHPLTLILMNPNYAREVEATVRRLGRDAVLLSAVDEAPGEQPGEHAARLGLPQV